MCESPPLNRIGHVATHEGSAGPEEVVRMCHVKCACRFSRRTSCGIGCERAIASLTAHVQRIFRRANKQLAAREVRRVPRGTYAQLLPEVQTPVRRNTLCPEIVVRRPSNETLNMLALRCKHHGNTKVRVGSGCRVVVRFLCGPFNTLRKHDARRPYGRTNWHRTPRCLPT